MLIMQNALLGVVVCIALMFTLGGEANVGSMTVNAQGITLTDLSVKAPGVTSVAHAAMK